MKRGRESVFRFITCSVLFIFASPMSMLKKRKNKRERKIVAHAALLVVCFWWFPFSLFTTPIARQSTETIINALLGHVEDHYQLHFGTVCIALPIILYKVGDGWLCFSSSRLFHHHNPVPYKGIVLEKGILTAKDESVIWDFSITKNVIAMLISALLMLLCFWSLANHMRKRQGKAAQGLWMLPFLFVRFVRNDIARKQIGKKHYERFTPYLLTLFFYILFNNLLGLLPEGANITGNISITLTLGAFTFFITHWNGSRTYWKHLFMPPGIPVLMYPIMVPVELLSAVLRPIILGVRLFANMFSGHLALLCMIGMIFIVQNLTLMVVAVPLGIGMILLKIFMSFIQAYVFTLFSAISFGAAVEEH